MSSVPDQTEEKEEPPKMYYEAVHEFSLEGAKTKIIKTLEEALEDKLIDKSEFNAMNPEYKHPAKFYCNFKVHKQNEHMNGSSQSASSHTLLTG